MATKYNGLLALICACIIVLIRSIRTHHVQIIFRDGIIILMCAFSLGSWKYIDNIKKYNDPFFANGTASQGFTIGTKYYWERYSFCSFPLEKLAHEMGPSATPGKLTKLDIYRSVPLTLHAMTWSDMGFFSVGGRHGSPGDMYPRRPIPVWLPMTVIVLGLFPPVLAFLGMCVTILRVQVFPLIILAVITITSYIHWFLSQSDWALKTKYILFLWPVFLIFALFGLRFLEVKHFKLSHFLFTAIMWLLVIICHWYMLVFSLAQVDTPTG
ncbi:hypothetical protein JXQ70_02480 [bacterium]|nr:hypothetical protein [bacterium]